MQLPLAAFDSHWEPAVWFALGVLGAIGVLAVLDPRRIAALATRGGGLAEPARTTSGATQPPGGRFYTLALCRVLGIALLSGAGAIAWFIAQR